MMFYISRVEIDGFWGDLKVATDLHDGTNIFIGRNGTGKTTFINLLRGALSVDPRLLISLQFSRILLRLHDGNRKRTVSVTKEAVEESSGDMLTYRIGRQPYKLPLSPRLLERTASGRYAQRPLPGHLPLQRAMAELVNVTGLSVYREADSYAVDDDFSPLPRPRPTPIDSRLHALTERLKSYQLQLSGEANAVSQEFQKKVLISILYDPTLDSADILGMSRIDLAHQREELVGAYDALGALDSDVETRIGHHVDAVTKSQTSVLSYLGDGDKGGRLDISALLSLPLIYRTRRIVDLSVDADRNKQAIFAPIARYVNLLRDFMTDKQIEAGLNSELSIKKRDTEIEIDNLSSGEKQLLIILTEALLQRGESYIYLADEPELSLHIEWQEKVISALRSLNPRSQVIVATHSPEIASSSKGDVIDMQDIIRG
jgi:ABC-type lipoprotein export system ATPase subunit